MRTTTCTSSSDPAAAGRVEGDLGERGVLPPGGRELAAAGGGGGEEEVRRHLRVRPVHEGARHHQEDQAGVRLRRQGESVTEKSATTAACSGCTAGGYCGVLLCRMGMGWREGLHGRTSSPFYFGRG